MVLALIVGLLLALLSSATAQEFQQVDSIIDQAKAAAEAKDYSRALLLFQAVITQFADHPRAPEAGIQIGHCHLKLSNRDAALQAFKYVVDTYRTSEYAPEAKQSLACCYTAKKDVESAIREFAELVDQYRASDQAPNAQLRIGYLNMNKLRDAKKQTDRNRCRSEADSAFKKLVELFPENRSMCAEAELQRAGIIFERALDKEVSWQIVETRACPRFS